MATDTTLTLLSPGTPVLLGPTLDPIDGTILAALLRVNEYVQYEVAYWDGKTRKVEWIASHEVRPRAGGASITKIGFAQ